MAYKDRRTDELIIEDGIKLIILSMDEEKYLGWHEDSDGNIVDEIDRNQIEIAYREDDEGGWAVGGGEYFSTYDIKNMADGIRNVIHHKTNNYSYGGFRRNNANVTHGSNCYTQYPETRRF